MNLMERWCKIMCKRLCDFFNRYDEIGLYHNGFLQSINLSSYVDITMLNEITYSFFDSFIKNEIGAMLVSHKWSEFLKWDNDLKEYKIKSSFYDEAKNTLYVYLLRGEKIFSWLDFDFKSLSASETKQIQYGQMEHEKFYDKVILKIEKDNDTTQYGQTQTTLNFGNNQIENTYGQVQRTLNYGQTEKSNIIGAITETNTIGSQSNTSETIHQLQPYDLQSYVNDTKDIKTDTLGNRSDNHNVNSRTDTETNNTHIDTDTTASYTDQILNRAREDTEINASHTDTKTFGDETKTTNERLDTDTIKTHIDTETKTKTILISPEKYFAIQKELLQYNVYDILKDSIKQCFTISAFESR